MLLLLPLLLLLLLVLILLLLLLLQHLLELSVWLAFCLLVDCLTLQRDLGSV